MFGSQPATTGAFGSTTGAFGASTGGSAFGAAKPSFGFGSTSTAPAFGTTTSSAPAFGSSTGGFGTAATSSFGTSFGSTGFGATVSSAAPSFGFGSTTSSAPTFSFGGASTGGATTGSAFGSSFGTTTSSAPLSFGGGFGTATSSSGPSFGATGAFGGGSTFGGGGTSFGTNFGGGTNTFGGGGGFMQNQQMQQQQQAPPNVTEQLLNSIMRVSLFGDDRDNLLARWNLLLASWGVGKAYYAQNVAPLGLSNENPLCRFKAIGYSAIPKSTGDTNLLSLIMKKKPAEVEPIKQALINDLQAALGNKPNIKVVIDSVESYGSDNSRINFHVTESTAPSMSLMASQQTPAQVRKINANDIFNALNQGNIWPQLQQRHNLETLAPKVAFAEEQLKEYLKNTPFGVDPRLWKQAQLDNPNSKSLLPVPLVGFKALQSRIKRQEHQAKIYQGRLDEIANDIAESQKRQQDNSAKLRDAKRKQLELSHRVLNIITRQEMTRKLGFTIQIEEEKLRILLEALQSQLSAPTQFKGRLNELLSQVRLQSQVNGFGGSDQKQLDQFAKEDIKHLLKQQHEGIQSLISTMKNDLTALEVMNEKLSKGMKKQNANK